MESKEKEIEELGNVLDKNCTMDNCSKQTNCVNCISKALYNAGYKKVENK